MPNTSDKDSVTKTTAELIDKLQLKLNRYKEPLNSLYNIIQILTHHPNWQNCVKFDNFSLRFVKCKLPPFPDAELGNWSDFDNIQTIVWIDKYFNFEPTTLSIQNAITSIAKSQCFHPVQDYLQSLKWDGEYRVNMWCEKYLGAIESPASRIFQKCALIGAVARVMKPGEKVDEVLIIEGQQGIKKSTALQVLYGAEWFTDAALDIGSKDCYLGMRGKWCVEMAELDKMKRAEASKAKAFFSQRKDEYREPYGRNVVDVPRQCVFIGTVNESEYLNDPTGNRRYMPITVYKIDIKSLARDRDQIWAEAYHLYTSGEPWYFNASISYIKEAQTQRYDNDSWQEPIEQFLDNGVDGRLDKVHTVQIQEMLGIELAKFNRMEANRIKQIMEHLGWKKGSPTINYKKLRGYYRQ